MVLLIDDKPESKHFHGIEPDRVARNYREGIAALQERRWDLLLLDHDLGDIDAAGREWGGYEVALWLEEHPEYLPLEVVAVSRNPKGRERIDAAIASAHRRARELGVDVEGPLAAGPAVS